MVYLAFLFLIFRRIEQSDNHRLRNLIYLALITILISLASYWFFFYVNSTHSLTYNSFLHLHLNDDHSIASGTALVGLYTIQETPYQIRFDSASYPITHIRSRTSDLIAPMPYRLHEDPGARKMSGIAEAWFTLRFPIPDACQISSCWAGSAR